MSKNYRQTPALAELIINLLFFAVCACIIIGIFAYAYTTNEKAVSQQEALMYAQHIAEAYKADSDSVFTSWTHEGKSCYINKTFSHTDYTFIVSQLENTQNLNGITLSASANDVECFSFEIIVCTQVATS